MKLKLENGMNYFINAQGERVCSGAKLGRIDSISAIATASKENKLRLEKLKIDYDGYDQAGAYWGHSSRESIYCAWGKDNENNPIWIFVWATDREDAKKAVRSKLWNAKFYR